MSQQRQHTERSAPEPERPTTRDTDDAERYLASNDPAAADRHERPRLRWLRRWPPILWLLVFVAGVLILNGGNGQWSTLELALGIGLAGIACGLALYLALGPWPGRPKPKGLYWFIWGVAGFYGVCAIAAGIFAGPAYVIPTLLAGIITMTAIALWVAGARAKTVRRPGEHEDAALADSEDPLPAMGVDEERPLGDTSEAHGRISPHDLPKDHPGREAAEVQAEALGGDTPGHREGAATDAEVRGGKPTDELVDREEEEKGARLRR